MQEFQSQNSQESAVNRHSGGAEEVLEEHGDWGELWFIFVSKADIATLSLSYNLIPPDTLALLIPC